MSKTKKNVNIGASGKGGRNPGAGSLQEAGEERAASGIPKVVGTGRNRKKNSQICVIFCNRKCTKNRRSRNQEIEY